MSATLPSGRHSQSLSFRRPAGVAQASSVDSSDPAVLPLVVSSTCSSKSQVAHKRPSTEVNVDSAACIFLFSLAVLWSNMKKCGQRQWVKWKVNKHGACGGLQEPCL